MRKICWMLCLLCVLSLGARAEEFVVTQEQAPDTVHQEIPVPLSATPVPVPESFDALRLGYSGETVLLVQRRLSELGYFGGAVDGSYGADTQEAVSAFQRFNGLAATGKVNATTWHTLMGLEVILGETDAPEAPTGTPAPGDTPVPAAATLPAGQAPALTRTLRYDATGEDVRLLQQRLAELGYYGREISGNFYSNTKDAVQVFQRKHLLSDDGVVGEKTWGQLFAPDAIPAAGDPKPLQYELRVDVTNQVTYAYELDDRGEYSILARQMICSTGMKGYETPQKTTQSAGSRARWGYFPKWGSYAQYLTRIDKSNAFHSVLYRETDVYTLSEGNYRDLGKAVSHGCVRLLVADAKWIYDHCPNGTTITVYAGEPDPELTEMLKPPPLNRSTMLPSEVPPKVYPDVWSPLNPPAPRLLSKGSEGEDVWWLQNLLWAMGYYGGTLSGGYFGGTQEAIRAYQRDQGLPADGICGDLTWQRLLAEVREQTGEDALPALSPVETVFPLPSAPTQEAAPAQTLGPVDLHSLPDVETLWDGGSGV